MSILKLKLLGQVECRTADGAQLTLSTRKSEVLLAYLALAPGIRHPRERLINLLWSDRSEEQARNSLRQALSAIKKSLDSTNPELLEVDRTTVRLNPQLVQVDSLDFDHHAAQTDIDNLASAAALYQGEFLEGIVIRDAASQEWLSNERNRFKRQIVEVLSGLSHLHLTSGQHKQAIESAEQLVVHDPLHEHGWRILMRAYHQKGDRNHALLTYKRCSQVLVKELGIEPEPETTALRDSIISGNLGDTKVTPTVAISSEIVTENSATDSGDKEHSILVLPFENLSDDSDQQYFSDGLTEGIIMGLSLFPALKVHSRHSSFAAAEKNWSIEEIGREFRSLYVVEGSVRKTNDQVRITAQLVNTQSGEQIWGKRFDSKFDEVLSLEDQITQSIVAIIKGKIDITELKSASRKPAKDMQSYDLLMRGKYHLFRFNPQDTAIATELLKKCLESDPNNSDTHASIYRAYLSNWISGWTEPRSEALEIGGFHIQKALDINPDDANVQSSYAEYLAFTGEFEQAEIHANRAMELNPYDADVLAMVSGVHASLGNIQESLDLADVCQRLDPFHPLIVWITGIAYYRGKKYREALQAFQKMPNPNEEIDGWIAACHERLGDHDNACKYLNLYLESARKNMARFPTTLDQWKQIWHDTAAYRHEDGIDYPFDALCDAGLKQFVEEDTTGDPASELHSIAVLPFDNLSGDPEQEYFSDGITESIILNLTLFPELQVKSRNSSFAFKQQIKSLGEISKELAVDYIVEGSIRKAGDHIRITVQLIEAASGNQIWGNRYESSSDKLFDLEEQLSRQIAATVTGRIESDLESTAIAKSAADKQSYDLLLAGRYHANKFTRQDMVTAITYLDQCLAQDPYNVQAHAQLYVCHSVNWMEGWTEDYKESFRLAGKHSHKALALDPDDSTAQWTHAEYLLFSREYEKAAHLINKALSANPYNPYLLANKSFNLIMVGEYKSALKFAETSCQLDPYNSWTSWMLAEAQLLSDQPQAAIDTMLNSKTAPSFFYGLLAIAYLRVNELNKSREVVQKLIHSARESMLSMPGNRDEWVEYWLRFSPYKDISIGENLIDELVQIGLCDDASLPAESESTQLPTIVVLPFDNLSGDPQQEYFSDGITESVILCLSAFNDLDVKSRHSSFIYKDSHKSLSEIGEDLGIQYVIEGSVRLSSSKIRITAQLVEAESGNQVWGKRYDTDLEQIFELEEELSQTIAGTIYGRIGKQIKQAKYQKPAKNQKAYDYLMRAWYHGEKMNPVDAAIMLEQIQKCLEIDPDNADAQVSAAANCSMSMYENWVVEPAKSLDQAYQHIERAIELDPGNALGHAFKAEVLHLKRDFDRSLYHADKAIELNPMLPDGLAMKAYLLAGRHEFDEAIQLAERSIELDPHHPYTAWNAGQVFFIAGEYDRALTAFRSMPNLPTSLHAEIAACLVNLGNTEQARTEMKVYLDLARSQMANYPTSPAQWRQLWTDIYSCEFEEDFEKLFDALLEAGLCDETEDQTDDMPSIAVLPFENMSGDPKQEYFSDGISASLILGLGLFSGLNVKSQNSSFAFKDSKLSSTKIANELNADFLIEGSIRKSGSKVRLSVQLVESASDSQIWGKQYDAELEDILELEQELSQTVAATISGRIGHKLQQSASRKPAKNLHSYDYLLRGLYHLGRFTAKDLELARQMIEQCLEIDPDNATAHMNLSVTHNVEIIENWSSDRNQSVQSAKHHFNRALELDPENASAHAYAAEFLAYLRDFEQCEFHANKAIELNPNASEGYAMKAELLGYTRRVDEAVQYADKCLQLDPHSVGAGWCAGGVYRKAGLYQKAIKTFRSIAHIPTSVHALIATCFVSMDLPEEARKEMMLYKKLAKEEMTHYPGSETEWRSLWRDTMLYQFEDDFDAFFPLLLAAGLRDEIEDPSDDTPSIAVLPFENMSGDPEQEYFSDGITSDIIATLSRFRGMHVIARHSTLVYKERKASIEDIAAEQQVRYILEGSIRKSGNRIRVNAELIDSRSGENCWSESYDRDLDDIFSVQDEITQNITIAMKVLLRDGIRAREQGAGTKNIKAWEFCTRAAELQDSYIRDNINLAQELVKKALEIDPNYSFAWTALGWVHWQEAYLGWTDSFDAALDEAEQSTKKALGLDPESADAWNLTGAISQMRGQLEEAIAACLKAVSIAPGNAEAQALMAWTYCYAGNPEKALPYYQTALQLSPICPNWFLAIGGNIHQLEGRLQEAIASFSKSIAMEPESPLVRFYLIHALVEAGEDKEADLVAEEIRALDSAFKVSGLIRAISYDKNERDRFQTNLEKVGFHE